MCWFCLIWPLFDWVIDCKAADANAHDTEDAKLDVLHNCENFLSVHGCERDFFD